MEVNGDFVGIWDGCEVDGDTEGLEEAGEFVGELLNAQNEDVS